MENNTKIIFAFLFAGFLAISLATPTIAQLVGGVTVQTNPATYISNFQATLNGNFSLPYINNQVYPGSYTYFQWGNSASYGSQTPMQALNYSGLFFQNIANLTPGATYHFRAVAQGTFGTVYGQDINFTTTGSGGTSGTGTLIANKQVINLSSGSLVWQKIVSASPADVLSFAITLQAGGQDIHNVIVRDVLPANLIYKGRLTVNTNSNYAGDITAGLNIGTITAGQTTVVAYQAQIAQAATLPLGATTISNDATITSTEAGTQTSSSTVTVNKSLVQGASTVSTGLTNNLLTDSFLLPLLLIIAGLWAYRISKVAKRRNAC